MRDCEELHPVLSRVAEGEGSPEEAIRTARHLSDCTTCRIHFARERRLAVMLEQDLEDQLQVGEEFVRAVMANLPQGPPPPPRRKRRGRSSLRLAGLAGLLGLLPVASVSGPRLDVGALLPELPRLGLDGAQNAPEGLLGLTRILAMGLEAARLPFSSAPLPSGLWLMLSLVMAGLTLFLAFMPLLALATHRLLKAT